MAPSIYLINLRKDTHRLQAMTQQLGALSLAFERIEAIHGVQVPARLRPYFLDDHGQIASELMPGEVGCYASHLLVMERIADGGEPAVILEDDLQFDHDFPQILASLDRMPLDLELLKLSGQNRKAKIKVGALPGGRACVKYYQVPVGTGAYLITPAGARKFLNWKLRRFAPIDQDIRRPWDCGLVIYGVEPIPVRQNIGASTIATFGEPPRGRKHYATHRVVEGIARLAHDIRWLGPRNWLMALLTA